MEKFSDYPLTFSLIIINILVFLLPFIGLSEDLIFDTGALQGQLVVIHTEVWRLFSSMFLHAGAMHIVMNMLSLYIVGRLVERLFSSGSFLALYFISGVIGSLNSIYFHPMGWGVGASGAIFGLFGALMGFVLVHRRRMQSEFMEFMRSFGMILLLNLVIGFVFPSVDMSAHIGGLIAGIIGGAMVGKYPKSIWLYSSIMVILMLAIYSYLPALYPKIEGVFY